MQTKVGYMNTNEDSWNCPTTKGHATSPDASTNMLQIIGSRKYHALLVLASECFSNTTSEPFATSRLVMINLVACAIC